MTDFKLRLPDQLAETFDRWAADHGGRSPALRHLISKTCGSGQQEIEGDPKLGHRPEKLTVRLTRIDSQNLDVFARNAGLTRNAWVAALVRRRLNGAPTFALKDEISLLSVQTELRRIGVNVNQIARALNTSVLGGEVLTLELAYLEHLRTELQAHMSTLREAFVGNLDYWVVEP